MNLSVYFVTPEGGDPEALSLAAARGGATLVQLRDKHSTEPEMIRLARRLVAALEPLGVPLIVNDRIEVALAAGAAGLHVGQGDAPVAEMRLALGPRLLGLSVEALAHVRAVPEGVVDYLGVGPVWATPSKPDHAAPIGFVGLAEMVAAARVPCVAIGGLGLADVAEVRRAGAVGLAVVSAIGGADDPEAAARAFAEAWRRG